MSVHSQRMGVDGQWTDPNPARRPRGSVELADNLVCRRPGTLELRPGFKELDSDRAEFSGFNDVDHMFAHGGDVIVQASGANLKQYVSEIEFDAACPPNAVRGIGAGEPFYFCGTDGVRKLYVDTARTVPLGVPVPVLLAGGQAASGSLGAVQPLSQVAYRAVLQIVYEDERTVTSGFSARSVIYNSHATNTVSPSVLVFFPANLLLTAPTAKAFVLVYRSKNAAVAPPSYPPDELFLNSKVQLTSADITAGSVVIWLTDVMADTALGETLYTNPSVGTFKRNNARAPRADDLQIYAGSLFASRLQYPYRSQLRWMLTTTAQTGSDTGIGYRSDTSVGTTLNSPTLTGVTTTGLQVGMMVVVVGKTTANPGVPLTITALPGGGVVTLSENLTSASDAAATAHFYDAVHVLIDGEVEVFPTVSAGHLLLGVSSTRDESPMIAGEPFSTRSSTLRAFVVGDMSRFTQATEQPFMVNAYLEALDASGAAFRVAATHGDEFNPPITLPTVDSDDWTESDRTESSAAVAWSKNEEYEHFLEGPASNRVIGTAGIPILRIFATVDGLWILKARGDGVYRLTGFGERSGWRVDQVSKTCALLHPYLACSDGRSVYAWTNEGAVRIDAGGVRPISAGIVGHERQQLERTLDSAFEQTRMFCVANTKNHEIVWGLAGRTLAIWNTQTLAWTTWFREANDWAAACVSADLIGSGDEYSTVLLHPIDQGLVRQERAHVEFVDPGSVERADRDFAVTVATVATAAADGSVAVTIDSGSGWTPAVGDIVYDNPNRFIVTAFTSATAFTVDRAGITTGAVTAYEAFEAEARWMADFGGGPSLQKTFERAFLHCESTVQTRELDFTMQTPPIAEQEQTITLPRFDERLDDDSHEWPEDIRALPNTNAATGTRFWAGVRIRQADSRIRISGLTVQYRDAAPQGSTR